MKDKPKYIVVVAFPDGTRQEFIAMNGEEVGMGLSYKGGRIVAYRKLSSKSVE